MWCTRLCFIQTQPSLVRSSEVKHEPCGLGYMTIGEGALQWCCTDFQKIFQQGRLNKLYVRERKLGEELQLSAF